MRDLESWNRDQEGVVDTPHRSTGWILVAIALTVVVVMIAIGVSGVVSGRPQPLSEGARTLPSPLPADRSVSPDPPAVWLEDLSFVDVRTGRATPLPRSIRLIAGADNFQASPDGTKLAFDDGARIYVARVDGTRVRQIARGISPWWSPDGKRIAYVRDSTVLFVVDVMTRKIRHLFRAHEDLRGAQIYHPNFSVDGQRILFTMFERHMHSRLWTVPADGGRARGLPFRRAAFGTYSPDGTAIAYRRTLYDGWDWTEMTEGNVSLADADGTDPRTVGRLTGSMSQIDPQALWPMWSPDGTRIAYAKTYAGQVVIADPDTGGVTMIGMSKEGTNPSWLDDETLIVSGYQREV